MHAHQEKKSNVFHMHCLRRILGITWQDKVTNKVVLEKAGIPSLHTRLKQKLMRWLAMWQGWKMAAFQKTFNMVNCEKTNRTTPTTLQGCMQARPPGTWHKHRLLVSYCHRQRCLETHNKTGGYHNMKKTQRVKAEEKRLCKKTVSSQ